MPSSGDFAGSHQTCCSLQAERDSGPPSKPVAHCYPLSVKRQKEMHRVCVMGSGRAWATFPVSGITTLWLSADKPASQALHGDSLPRWLTSLSAHRCPPRAWALGGVALPPPWPFYPPTPAPQNSREDSLTSDDLRNRQPGRGPQAPLSHLRVSPERAARPGLCPK